jgi:hypothetical protein
MEIEMTRGKVVQFLANGSIFLPLTAIVFASGSATFAASSTQSAPQRPQALPTTSIETAPVVPAIGVTPSASKITTAQSLAVTAVVSGGSGKPVPTGTVRLTSGKFSSPVRTLAKGKFVFHIYAGRLAATKDRLTVTYTPDRASASNYKSASGQGSVTVAKATPALSAKLSAAAITTQEPLTVSIAVNAGEGAITPTGSVAVTSGAYGSVATVLENGAASISIPDGSLLAGTDTLAIAYTPDTKSAALYTAASGRKTVTVTKITPLMTVNLSSSTITNVQALAVTVSVAVGPGDVTPTGLVKVTGGSYSSAGTNLADGKAIVDVPAGTLPSGTETLSATYTPNARSSGIYNPVGATSPAVTVVSATTVSVDQSGPGPAVTDQILGMNMAAWYDPTTAAIVPAFQTAGIKAIRWPGGSWSDVYHWATNTICDNTANSNATFSNFVSDLAIPAGLDVALTADYGTSPTSCSEPGEPSEAAAWVKAALSDGITVSHMTVGNEEYGSWETDNHSSPHDPTTYAAAVTGTDGYYAEIKAANPKTLVGVDVSPGYDWDATVLANAKGSYDFVEYHFYPQAPFAESDTYLVQQAAQDLTSTINTIKSELNTAGTADTPIYVGEIGSVYTNPGKQSVSITQGLFAGQLLGEMMNDGVSRATWWIGFGNCNGANGNDSKSLYGWQDFGAYNVFSDGPEDTDCPDYGPAGTLSPTARAFQLFSNVAVNGESVLAADVAGDTTDVRAYAATHSGGTALVLFNLNETATEAVAVELSGQTASTGVTVKTYSKAIYDQTQNDVWAPPTTANLGAQGLPLSLFLAPWSMNVVLIK